MTADTTAEHHPPRTSQPTPPIQLRHRAGMRRRMRRRLIVGGAAAGAVAYHEGKKRGRRAEQEDQAEEPELATRSCAGSSCERGGRSAADLDEIERLAKLHESGALTDDEFASAKAKLLA